MEKLPPESYRALSSYHSCDDECVSTVGDLFINIWRELFADKSGNSASSAVSHAGPQEMLANRSWKSTAQNSFVLNWTCANTTNFEWKKDFVERETSATMWRFKVKVKHCRLPPCVTCSEISSCSVGVFFSFTVFQLKRLLLLNGA